MISEIFFSVVVGVVVVVVVVIVVVIVERLRNGTPMGGEWDVDGGLDAGVLSRSPS